MSSSWTKPWPAQTTAVDAAALAMYGRDSWPIAVPSDPPMTARRLMLVMAMILPADRQCVPEFGREVRAKQRASAISIFDGRRFLKRRENDFGAESWRLKRRKFRLRPWAVWQGRGGQSGDQPSGVGKCGAGPRSGGLGLELVELHPSAGEHAGQV